MSIIEKVIEFAASDVIAGALNAPIKVLDTTSQKLKERSAINKKKLFECAEGERALLINQERFTWRDKFHIFDSSESIKYSVQGEFTSIKHHLHIYDKYGKKVGFVKEKLLTLRPSAMIEADPSDFDLEINGRKVGKLKSKWSFGKKKYVLDNGWNIEGNLTGWKYKITCNDKIIATISSKPLY